MSEQVFTRNEFGCPHHQKNLPALALAPHIAAKQGMRPRIVERPVNKVEAIGTARALFPRCQFDQAGCSVGLKRLRTYRKEWDDTRGVWKDRPRHDEASHGADAFLTFACSNVPDEDDMLRRASWDRWRQRPLRGIA